MCVCVLRNSSSEEASSSCIALRSIYPIERREKDAERTDETIDVFGETRTWYIGRNVDCGKHERKYEYDDTYDHADAENAV